MVWKREKAMKRRDGSNVRNQLVASIENEMRKANSTEGTVVPWWEEAMQRLVERKG
jgi:hypothetical protein